MSFAKSLRVIGQSLEIAKLSLFRLEGDSRSCAVQSDFMSRTADWILRYNARESDFFTVARRRSANEVSVAVKPVEFSDREIARLDVQAAKGRREFSQTEPSMKLSQLLRSVGDHLDRNSAQTFHIFWLPDAVLVDYKGRNGLTDRDKFIFGQLHELGHIGLRRRLLKSTDT